MQTTKEKKQLSYFSASAWLKAKNIRVERVSKILRLLVNENKKDEAGNYLFEMSELLAAAKAETPETIEETDPPSEETEDLTETLDEGEETAATEEEEISNLEEELDESLESESVEAPVTVSAFEEFSALEVPLENLPANKRGRREKFERLSCARLVKLLKAIDLIGNLASTVNYDYNPSHVDSIFSAIDKRVAAVKGEFMETFRKKSRSKS